MRNVRDNRPELIQTGCMRNGFAGVLGFTSEAEGLGAVEGDRGACLTLGGGVGARKSSLFRGLSLGILAAYDNLRTQRNNQKL